MNLELSVSQKQTLSQRMQLYVRILQMNSIELLDFLHQSSFENPVIDLDDSSQIEERLLERLEKHDWLNSCDEANFSLNKSEKEDSVLPWQKEDAGRSLKDDLCLQLVGLNIAPDLEEAVYYLIDNLDENGFLSSLAPSFINKDTALFCKARQILHSMEPAGVGAVNIAECLLLQALRLPQRNPVLEDIICSHLELVARNQIDKIASRLGVLPAAVHEAKDILLSFNPKPGNGYTSTAHVPYIIPDFFVEKTKDGFTASFNSQVIPSIHINRTYQELAKSGDVQTKKYIDKHLSQAEWMISCINQRKETMQNTVQAILQKQRTFFEKGPGYLQPLCLADLAEELGVHLSTISRATSGKYLQCQWGVFSLGHFFVGTASQSSASSKDVVQRRIRELIEAEPPSKPLSDQSLADALGKEGITISRRTITKYREQLDIPPTYIRAGA